MRDIFAHSVPNRPSADWERLAAHAAAVATGCETRCAPMGFSALGRVAGLLHDIGKCSAAFQAYIDAGDAAGHGPDHSTAGALEARRLHPGPVGRILAFAIAGHHAGLADGDRLEARLGSTPPDYRDWEAEVGPPPPAHACQPRLRAASPHRGFSFAFLIRMVFSCLVDADFVETEAFYAPHEGRDVRRGGFAPPPILEERLRRFMDGVRAKAPSTPVNALRAAVLDHATAKAALAPGLFTLTVPTGGGKTLASLSFALAHACRYDLRRVIYVIPFMGARIETFRTSSCRTAARVAPSRGRGSKLCKIGDLPLNRSSNSPDDRQGSASNQLRSVMASVKAAPIRPAPRERKSP